MSWSLVGAFDSSFFPPFLCTMDARGHQLTAAATATRQFSISAVLDNNNDDDDEFLGATRTTRRRPDWTGR